MGNTPNSLFKSPKIIKSQIPLIETNIINQLNELNLMSKLNSNRQKAKYKYNNIDLENEEIRDNSNNYKLVNNNKNKEAKKSLLYILNNLSNNEYCPEIKQQCSKEKEKRKEDEFIKIKKTAKIKKKLLLDKLEIKEESLNNKKEECNKYNSIIKNANKKFKKKHKKLIYDNDFDRDYTYYTNNNNKIINSFNTLNRQTEFINCNSTKYNSNTDNYNLQSYLNSTKYNSNTDNYNLQNYFKYINSNYNQEYFVPIIYRPFIINKNKSKSNIKIKKIKKIKRNNFSYNSKIVSLPFINNNGLNYDNYDCINKNIINKNNNMTSINETSTKETNKQLKNIPKLLTIKNEKINNNINIEKSKNSMKINTLPNLPSISLKKNKKLKISINKSCKNILTKSLNKILISQKQENLNSEKNNELKEISIYSTLTNHDGKIDEHLISKKNKYKGKEDSKLKVMNNKNKYVNNNKIILNKNKDDFKTLQINKNLIKIKKEKSSLNILKFDNRSNNSNSSKSFEFDYQETYNKKANRKEDLKDTKKMKDTFKLKGKKLKFYYNKFQNQNRNYNYDSNSNSENENYYFFNTEPTLLNKTDGYNNDDSNNNNSINNNIIVNKNKNIPINKQNK